MPLPAELEGKTPEEMMAYYQTQMNQQRQHYEAAIEAMNAAGAPQGGNNQPPPKKTSTELISDPEGTIKGIIDSHGVTRAEFTQMTQSQQQNLIWIAKQRAMEDLRIEAQKRGGSFDWDKVAAMLEDVAKKCDPLTLTNSEVWKTNYYYNRGVIADTLVKEGVNRATLPMESGSPGGSPPPKDTPLTMEELKVAEGFGLTEETYKTGKINMINNNFPLTRDNRTRS